MCLYLNRNSVLDILSIRMRYDGKRDILDIVYVSLAFISFQITGYIIVYKPLTLFVTIYLIWCNDKIYALHMRYYQIRPATHN